MLGARMLLDVWTTNFSLMVLWCSSFCTAVIAFDAFSVSKSGDPATENAATLLLLLS